MSTFGHLFRVTTFGESHGLAVGCVVDGVPPGLRLTESDIQPQLTRRRPGQSTITTARNEKDKVTILSGVERGVTLGTPIAMKVDNEDQRKFDYANTATAPRPGHADYTYDLKYGVRASSGGGRASARETISRVAAGALADKYLAERFGSEIVSFVCQVGDIRLNDAERRKAIATATRDSVDRGGRLLKVRRVIDAGGVPALEGFDEGVTRVYLSQSAGAVFSAAGEVLCEVDGDAELVPEAGAGEAAPDCVIVTARVGGGAAGGEAVRLALAATPLDTRCPHPPTAARIADLIEEHRALDDTIGGAFTCALRGVPVGLGEPAFDKFEAELARAMMSLPATKAFEIGEGFDCCAMRGSAHNDRFAPAEEVSNKLGDEDKLARGDPRVIRPTTNHGGGTLGGITSGETVYCRVAVKAASSIGQKQLTANFDGSSHELAVKGRHDPCVLPRAPPLAEGMASMVLLDMVMRQDARAGGRLPKLE